MCQVYVTVTAFLEELEDSKTRGIIFVALFESNSAPIST